MSMVLFVPTVGLAGGAINRLPVSSSMCTLSGSDESAS
jgi:hypothetical protein